MALTAADVHWIAGFLDGEGWFGPKGRTIGVTAYQKDEWHVRRLETLLGGNVRYQPNRTTPSGKPTFGWRWDAYGALGAGVMMTVYPLMSPRRRQRIEATLQFWKELGRRGKHFGTMTHCKAGHEYTAENTAPKQSGGRQCRECMKKYRADYLARKNLASRGASPGLQVSPA